jgi:hypothetical protein
MSRFYVQIVNEDEAKAVRFPFDDETKARRIAAELNALFHKHQTNSVVGVYAEGEVCPRHQR